QSALNAAALEEQTGLDAVATAADRVQTGLDRTAAAGSASSANDSAISAAESESNAPIIETNANNSAIAAAESESNAADSEETALKTLPITSSTPPPDPLEGAEWIDTDNGRRYTWVVDEDSSQ